VISVAIQHHAGKHIVRKVSQPGKVPSINRCVLIFSARRFLCPVVSGSMINMWVDALKQDFTTDIWLHACILAPVDNSVVSSLSHPAIAAAILVAAGFSGQGGGVFCVLT
jgi:hypothetical protein